MGRTGNQSAGKAMDVLRTIEGKGVADTFIALRA